MLCFGYRSVGCFQEKLQVIIPSTLQFQKDLQAPKSSIQKPQGGVVGEQSKGHTSFLLNGRLLTILPVTLTDILTRPCDETVRALVIEQVTLARSVPVNNCRSVTNDPVWIS